MNVMDFFTGKLLVVPIFYNWSNLMILLETNLIRILVVKQVCGEGDDNVSCST